MRRLRDPFWWTLVALAVSLLLSGEPGGSGLVWLLPGLFTAYAVAWGWRRHSPPPRRSPGVAAAVYLGVGACSGVIYELSLSTDGTGYGGLHPDPVTSFLLLPGYLVPALLGTWWMVRRYGLDARRLFFAAGVLSWYEALVSHGATFLVAPWSLLLLGPFFIASYAVYCGAPGLLCVAPESLWATSPRAIGAWRLAAVAALIGAACWICYAGWAAGVLAIR
jgi:hypothetical protein